MSWNLRGVVVLVTCAYAVTAYFLLGATIVRRSRVIPAFADAVVPFRLCAPPCTGAVAAAIDAKLKPPHAPLPLSKSPSGMRLVEPPPEPPDPPAPAAAPPAPAVAPPVPPEPALPAEPAVPPLPAVAPPVPPEPAAAPAVPPEPAVEPPAPAVPLVPPEPPLPAVPAVP